ncbi:MAG: hypothetical protein OEV76_11470, partial [Anaerolineae bacterium]|nr:hypothetical protein [Anaerolineae bacterium]
NPGSMTVWVAVVAVVLLLVLGVLGFWLEIYYRAAGRFGAGIPASGPFFLLFVLAAAATVLGLRRLGLTRKQLLSVYAIVLVGAPVTSYKVMGSMLVHATIQRYLGMTSNSQWQGTFLDLVPGWLAPSEWYAVEGFYHGLGATPWSVWWTPLAVWCSFLVALAVCSVCVVLLFQRQWITHERLTFPLAQIPLEMVVDSEAKNGRRHGRLAGVPLFWIGLAVSFGLTALETLSRYVPAIPAVPLGPVRLMEWRRVGPLAGLDEINLVLWPWLTAIAYLIPKDLSFSCWFFWYVRLGLHVIAIAAGATPQRPAFHWVSEFPAPLFQGTGALMAIAMLAVWSGRSHLKRAVRIAFSRESGRADADEPIPYRWTLIALAVCFAWMVYLCWLEGCRVGVGIVLITLILTYYMTWVRLRAETGLGFLPYPLFLHQSIVVPLGAGVFNPRDLIMIHATHWAYHSGGDTLDVVPGNALESMKVADAAGIRKRGLILAMGVGFLLTVVIGAYVTLTGIYRYGLYNIGAGTADTHELNVYSTDLHQRLMNPSSTDVPGTIAMGVGALVTFFLGAMRLRFWWWPFHPIGYLASNTWVMYMYSTPFIIGWLAKTLVVRYGGLRLFRRTVPLAIGFIAGDLLNEVLWGAVTLVTGVPFKPGRTW